MLCECLDLVRDLEGIIDIPVEDGITAKSSTMNDLNDLSNGSIVDPTNSTDKDKEADKKATVPLITRKVEEKKWEWEDDENNNNDDDDDDDIELGGSKDSKDDYKKGVKIEALPVVDKTKVMGMFQKKTEVKSTTTTPSSKPKLIPPFTPQGVDLFASTGIVAKPKFNEEKKSQSNWDEEDLLDD
jgi:hypothetical protein